MTTFSEIANTILGEISHCLQQVSSDDVDRLRQAILSASRIFIAGRGRSSAQMRAFAIRLVHLGLTVYVVDEAVTPAIQEGDLLIVGSASGCTASLVQYAQRAKSVGARVALISISASSPVADHAHLIVQVMGTSPKLDHNETISIQPEGSLFEQTLLLLLDTLVVQMMMDRHINSAQMFSRHANLE